LRGRGGAKCQRVEHGGSRENAAMARNSVYIDVPSLASVTPHP